MRIHPPDDGAGPGSSPFPDDPGNRNAPAGGIGGVWRRLSALLRPRATIGLTTGPTAELTAGLTTGTPADAGSTGERPAADPGSAAALPEACLPRVAALREAGAFDEADAILWAAPGGPCATPVLAINWAQNAQARGDRAEALRRWNEGRKLFPEVPAFWASELAALQTLDRLAEAEALARNAAERFPDSIEVLTQVATVAATNGDLRSARERWHAVFERFPEHPFVREHRGHIENTLFTTPGGAGDDAARLRELEATGRWADAVPLRRAAFERAPGDLGTVIGFGQALREAGCFDEADRVLFAAAPAHPDSAELAAQHAQVAVKRVDWPEALRRWQAVLRRFPDVPALWQMAAVAFRETGRMDEAEDLVARAMERHPDRVDLMIEHAQLAERRGDWDEAVARWNRAMEQRPDDAVLRNCRGDALWHRDAQALEDGRAVGPSDPPRVPGRDPGPGPRPDLLAEPRSGSDGVAAGDPGRALALQFEGLGDNCDFGVVQRRLGADPLGLLRFAAISPRNLTAMLDERFERLGDPAHLELSALPVGEYMLRDTRGLFHTHTFVRVGSVDEPAFLRKQIGRIGFLKRKLIEDLEAGTKIFVYKSTHARMDDDSCRALHRALNRYGANALLVVQAAVPEQPPGSVRVLEERLLVGHLDYDGDLDLGSWREIMVAAQAHAGDPASTGSGAAATGGVLADAVAAGA